MCYDFGANNSGDNLSISASVDAILDVTVPFTVFMRVRRESDGADFAGIFCPQLNTNDAGWLTACTADNKLSFYLRDSSYISCKSNAILPLNRDVVISCTGDGTTGRTYIDGVLQSATISLSTITTGAGGSQRAILGAYPTGHASDLGFPGKIYYAGLTHKCWTDAQAASFARDEYQILRPSVPAFYFTSAGGGGGPATYDVSVAYGLSQGLTHAGGAQAMSAVVLTNQFGCSEGAGAQTTGAVSLDNIVGVTSSALAQAQAISTFSAQLNFLSEGMIAFFVDVSLGTTVGTTVSGTSQGSGAVLLGTQLSHSVNSIAQAIASVLFNTDNSFSVSTAAQQLEAAISLGVSQGYTPTATILVSGEVTLAAQLAAQLSAAASADGSLNLGAQIGFSVVAQAAAQAGIVLEQVQSMTVSGSVVTFGVVTPDERIFNIQVDLRDFQITCDERIYKP